MDDFLICKSSFYNMGGKLEKVVVAGQGYVGLPLAQGACRAGFEVFGYDLNETVVAGLNGGNSHVGDVSDRDLEQMIGDGYKASSDPSVFEDADFIIICVPTPLSEERSPDLSAVYGVGKTIVERHKRGAVIVLESTTYPGTTNDVLHPMLSANGGVVDSDFFLAFSPERIDPGNKRFSLFNTPKVVGGVTARSTERASDFYGQVVEQVVAVKGAREAETAKLLENTYRHINIALVNEMARFCHELKIDLWDVIDAAKTKPFGFQAFYPGPGVGGHCIPIDPNYLGYQVQKVLGRPFRFVELAEEINHSMPEYVVSRAQDLLNEQGKAVKGSKVLLLGVAYKANIADARETPALPIAQLLMAKGAQLNYHDPRVSSWHVDEESLASVNDLEVEVPDADIVILLQNHDEYDVELLASLAGVFFDTRGATRAPNCSRL